MKNLIMASGFLFTAAFIMHRIPASELYGQAALFYFLPGLSLIFLFVLYLAEKLGTMLEQPPISIFIGSMGLKILLGMILLLVYLSQRLGPQIEGALVFMGIYLVFEILEIKRFLSILRTDSRESSRE